jgi:hypothetical protein
MAQSESVMAIEQGSIAPGIVGGRCHARHLLSYLNPEFSVIHRGVELASTNASSCITPHARINSPTTWQENITIQCRIQERSRDR